MLWRPRNRHRLLIVAFVLSGALALPHAALSYTFGSTVRPIGPYEVVFDHSASDGSLKDACEQRDIPDMPARAFRDARGRVQLIAAHHVNRRFVGSSLGTVSRDCRIVMGSHHRAEPWRYDDSEWISSAYTGDGKTIYALVHDEYHGWEHFGMCPTATDPNGDGDLDFDGRCWYNAVTLASSRNPGPDWGSSYSHSPPPSHLVASIPYRYVRTGSGCDISCPTKPYGIFQPSNIIRTQRSGDDRSYYYAMLHVEGYPGLKQQTGTCVMRTSSLADPMAWRAWGGSVKGFAVRFTDPYTYPYSQLDPPSAHVCQTVSYEEIEKMNSSVTYNAHFKKYLLVGTTGKWTFDASCSCRKLIDGIYYSLSSDLVHWSPRRLLLRAPLTVRYRCGLEDPIAYSALLDAGTASRNFGRTGQGPGHTTYLYFTRFHYRHRLDGTCHSTLDRDLVRIPIVFTG